MNNTQRLAELEAKSADREKRLYMAALHRIAELERQLAEARVCRC